ncbi:MAG: hypothetical protein ACTSYA_13225 [Candidatus Kariarchaeaceae archaeon]
MKYSFNIIEKNLVEYKIKDLNTDQLTTSSIPSVLELYKTIPIAFEVHYVYKLDENKTLSANLTEVDHYIKNYCT